MATEVRTGREGASLPRPVLTVKKDSRGLAQRDGQLGHDHDRGIANPALDAADIGAVEAALEGQILLRPALFAPQFLDVQAKPTPYIHADSGRRRSQLIYSR